jgi:membrane glycosyltransferase
MPIQTLGRTASTSFVRDQITAPRAVLLLLTLGATSVFAFVLYQVLAVVRLMPLQGVFLVLCTLCFAWIALGSSNALIGFFAALAPRRLPLVGSVPQGSERTALLFPVYHEDAARVAATIEAISNELAASGHAQNFHVFILSDSRDPRTKSLELRAARHLRRRLRGQVAIYYRARAENSGKKAGNIADWVERFGSAYRSFIILDADSILSGSAIVHLTATLEANPTVGLVQTAPRLVGASTLFAHLQQFAVAFHGPVFSAGFAAWHQGSGNYWGHNAIIRTRAFAGAAGLPNLPGAPPLGGHIQSHDFVEAAFLRRAGWEVWLLPDLEGTYEGCPPTLIDAAVRDRRWAQGNLQHLRIVGASGLPWVSRLHLAMGTYSYLASVFWAFSLIVGIALSIQSAVTIPVYFTEQKTLFPVWPVIDPTKALYLFAGTAVVVFLPKILGIALALLRGHVAGRQIGWFLLGAFVEIVLSMLMAPIFMLTQTNAVWQILRGKDSGWSVQRRNGEAPHLTDLIWFHRWHLLVGAIAAVTCALASWYVLAWMAPIILGLLLSAHLSALTARPPNEWLKRALATPEAMYPPPILDAASAAHFEWVKLLDRAGPPN